MSGATVPVLLGPTKKFLTIQNKIYLRGNEFYGTTPALGPPVIKKRADSECHILLKSTVAYPSDPYSALERYHLGDYFQNKKKYPPRFGGEIYGKGLQKKVRK